MKTQEKKTAITSHVISMFEDVKQNVSKKIEKALNSGAIDLDEWDEQNNRMILPKSILIAILESEADQYKATGTSFEKQVNKEVKNLKYFL